MTQLGLHRLRAAQDRGTSQRALAALAQSPEQSVAEAALANPNCPSSQLIAASNSPVKWVRRAVARNSNLPAEAIAALTNERYEDVMCEFVSNSAVPAHVLRQVLHAHDRFSIQLAIAANPSCPEDSLAYLSASESVDVRHAVAMNPQSSTSTLEVLGGDSHKNVRLAVLRNANAPKHLLANAVLSKDAESRCAVAQNSALPLNSIAFLNEEPGMVYFLVENPAVPNALLELYARHDDCFIRALAAANPSLNPKALELLIGDPNGYVRYCASNFRPEDELPSPTELASDVFTSTSVLDGLADLDVDAVDLALVRNPSLPIYSLLRLLRRRNDWTSSNLAENGSSLKLPTDAEWQEMLILSKRDVGGLETVWDFIERGACRPAMLASLLEVFPSRAYELGAARMFDSACREWLVSVAPQFDRLLESLASNPTVDSSVLASWADSDSDWLRLSVAQNPACPVNVLEELAEDWDARVRGAVFSNPRTPDDVARRLMEDSEAVACAKSLATA